MSQVSTTRGGRRTPALTVAIAIVVVVVAALMAGVAPAAASDSASTLGFEPRETDAAAGETVTVDVTMSDHGDLFGNGVAEFELSVAYDGDLLTLTDVDHDPWLDDGTADVDATSTVDEETGTLTLAETRDPPGDGVRGSGPVATLTFEVAEDADPANAALTIEDATVLLTSDYPQAIYDREATIYVDGGVEPDDDGDDPSGITLGDPDRASGSNDDSSTDDTGVGTSDGDTTGANGADDGDDEAAGDGGAGDDSDDGGDGAPGFGVLLAIVAGTGVLVTLARRTDRR